MIPHEIEHNPLRTALPILSDHLRIAEDLYKYLLMVADNCLDTCGDISRHYFIKIVSAHFRRDSNVECV